jgi:HSP90 family molecular chaperone
MKLNVIGKEVITSGLSNQKKFTIEASSKAFKILSAKLYENQIRAIIRELSCNAYDSHIASGHKKPFDIKLPSQYDPIFYIRDYGTGLSEHDVYANLYYILQIYKD